MGTGTQMSPAPSLKGSGTTTAGILALIVAGMGLYMQIMGAVHGGTLDPTALTTGVSGLLGGIGLIRAADAKQKP